MCENSGRNYSLKIKGNSTIYMENKGIFHISMLRKRQNG